MERNRQAGDVVNYEQPVWGPLEALLDEALVGWFMWMHEVRLRDGTVLHAYKHRSTRRYFHLDTAGGAFDFDDGDYVRVPLSFAVAEVFASWPRLGGTPVEMDLVGQAWDRAARRERAARVGAGDTTGATR